MATAVQDGVLYGMTFQSSSISFDDETSRCKQIPVAAKVGQPAGRRKSLSKISLRKKLTSCDRVVETFLNSSCEHSGLPHTDTWSVPPMRILSSRAQLSSTIGQEASHEHEARVPGGNHALEEEDSIGALLNPGYGREAVLKFLAAEGIRTEFIDNLTLPEDIEIMKQRLEYLHIIGLDPIQTLNEFPPLAGCSVSRNFIPVMSYFEEFPIGRADLAELIKKYPRVLYFSVKIDIEPIVDYLLGLGVARSRVPGVLVRYPQLLGFKIEGTLSTAPTYLVGLGVDLRAIGDIIAAEPEILGMRVGNNLLPKVEFLVSLGMTKYQVSKMIEKHPSVLQLQVDSQTRQVCESLVKVGVQRDQLGMVILRYPAILELSIEDVLPPVASWLAGRLEIDSTDLPGILTKLPQIMVIDVGKADHKIEYFLQVGFNLEQIRTMIRNCPQILGLNIFKSLNPRLQYLTRTMKRNLAEVVEYPQYLTFSLDLIQERYRKVHEGGLVCSLQWMLDCSNAQFNNRLEINVAGKATGGRPSFAEGPVVQPDGRKDTGTSNRLPSGRPTFVEGPVLKSEDRLDPNYPGRLPSGRPAFVEGPVLNSEDRLEADYPSRQPIGRPAFIEGPVLNSEERLEADPAKQPSGKPVFIEGPVLD